MQSLPRVFLYRYREQSRHSNKDWFCICVTSILTTALTLALLVDERRFDLALLISMTLTSTAARNRKGLRRMSDNPMEMPKSYIPGMIPTLNDTGFMTEVMDEYSQAFVDYAAGCEGPVLDMGCAYGVATLPALAAGATVTACDMDQGHLDILESHAPEKDKPRLTCLTGVLPEVDFPENTFDALLAARVLHFLNGPDINASVRKMASWLKPGGKAFLITDTVYTGFWKQHASKYEEAKAAGHPWPGEIQDAHLYLPEPARATTQIRYMNLLDPDVIRRVCEQAGLIVEAADYVHPGDHERDKAYGETDKERTGAIAVKPA